MRTIIACLYFITYFDSLSTTTARSVISTRKVTRCSQARRDVMSSVTDQMRLGNSYSYDSTSIRLPFDVEQQSNRIRMESNGVKPKSNNRSCKHRHLVSRPYSSNGQFTTGSTGLYGGLIGPKLLAENRVPMVSLSVTLGDTFNPYFTVTLRKRCEFCRMRTAFCLTEGQVPPAAWILGLGVLSPCKYVWGIKVCFDPRLKCHILSFKTVAV